MAIEKVGLSFTIGAGIKLLSRERLDINRQINLNPEKAEKFKTRLSEINKEGF